MDMSAVNCSRNASVACVRRAAAGCDVRDEASPSQLRSTAPVPPCSNPPPCPFPPPQVIPCTKRFVHDWTVCPFAHAGEKAVRRDPRVVNYTGIACPDMKKVGAGCRRDCGAAAQARQLG